MTIKPRHKKEWAIELFRNGNSRKEIAGELGLDLSTICKYLKTVGISIRNKSPMRYRQYMHVSGKSVLPALARPYKLPRERIINA